ncbi:MAG TPA: transglutaminase family protein [Azospirillaceae bacterium]|nr:transglutaminase family protein [Azospirillaceae bacterium]
MRYRARHTTRYDYGDTTPVSHHLVHLTPRPHPRQRCGANRITLTPAPATRSDSVDFFGNPVTYVAVEEPHRWVEIHAETDIEVAPPLPLDPAATPPWQEVREAARRPGPEVPQFLFDSIFVKTSIELTAFAEPSFPANRPVAESALDLMSRIHRDFTFDPTATTIATPLAEVLTTRRGVCQDFAHLMIGALRGLGLPARYVSGYLRTLPPPGQPRLVGADVSHAWMSVWCGGNVWLDLCPTNDKPADADYITLAWGRDYDDVSPVRGVFLGSGAQALSVQVDVEVIE